MFGECGNSGANETGGGDKINTETFKRFSPVSLALASVLFPVTYPVEFPRPRGNTNAGPGRLFPVTGARTVRWEIDGFSVDERRPLVTVRREIAFFPLAFVPTDTRF